MTCVDNPNFSACNVDNSKNCMGISPWVFVTYDCSCNCPYCMVPKVGSATMSSETFEKMCFIAEKLIESGEYVNVAFRLSGGEPFLAFQNYKSIVTNYIKKSNGKIRFGMLSNLTVLTDEMIDWLLENKIGVQVSLDGLQSSKPLVYGDNSAKLVISNIERLRQAGVNFSINTVYDITKNPSIRRLVDYVCEVNPSQWGLSASFALNDDSHLEEICDQIKLAVIRLRENNFDVYHKLRFYNEILGFQGSCDAGRSIFALGVNLEVWPCQARIDTPPLGFFDEKINQLLETVEGNAYFRNRTLLPQCTDCEILHWCRGGCRSVHLLDKKAVDVTCRIKREVIKTMLLQSNSNNNSFISCNNHSDTDMKHSSIAASGLNSKIEEHINSLSLEEIKLVETPPLDFEEVDK